MMSRKIFSSKKLLEHGAFLRMERATVWGGEKGKYGKRKKEGDLGDNK